jgi:ketosteroid isomerase-like protein
MEQSSEVERVVARFYEAIEAGTTAAFDRVVSHDPGAMVIGTDRWLGDRDTWGKAFPSLRGITVEPGDAQGFRHGDFGWAVDRPVFVLPGGSRLPTRLSAVVREEDDGWKIIHVHISVQVPDEVAVDEAAGWEAATSA